MKSGHKHENLFFIWKKAQIAELVYQITWKFVLENWNIMYPLCKYYVWDIQLHILYNEV